MKGKFTFKKLVLTGAVIVFILSLFASSVIYNNTNVNTSVDNAGARQTTIKIKSGNTEYTKKVTLNNPIIGTGSFKLEGINIVKAAKEYLGYTYNASYLQPTGNGVDCTGLIHLTLRDLGVMSVNGILCRDGYTEGRSGHPYNGVKFFIPRSPQDWEAYDFPNYTHKFFKEIGTWAYDKTIGGIGFGQPNSSGTSIYDRSLNIQMVGDSTKYRMDVLKVNDPITDELRWYNYYDSDGNLKDLPIGTLVISYSGQYLSNPYFISSSGHGWICIGNLETSDASVAADKLIKMGIIDPSQRNYVTKDENSNSTYWLIESTVGLHKDKNGNNVDGVRISNWDPDLRSTDGKKGVGSVWAFQIANGVAPQPTYYNLKIAKADAETGSYVSGVTLKYNTSSLNSAAFDGTKWQSVSSGTSAKDVITNRKIDNTTADCLYFGESEANSAGYVLTGGTYGLNVYKTLDTSTYPAKYKISQLTYYSGSGDNYKRGDITQGGKYWITRDRDLVADSDATEKQKLNAIAYINYDTSTSTPTITYTCVDKKLDGDYHLKIVKKPDGESNDDNIIEKYSTAMAGAKFEIKQYKNKAYTSISDLQETPDDYGRTAGQTTNVAITSAGEAADVLFKQEDNSYSNVIKITDTSKTDIYRIEESEAPEGTYIDWKGPVALIVTKKVLNNQYVIDKIALATENGKTDDVEVSDKSTAWIRVNKNGEVTESKDDYAVAFEASRDTVTITWRNPTETEGQYNVNVKKVDAKTQKAIEGVTFEVNGVSNVTGPTGIATYDTVTINKDNFKTIDSYTVEEKSLGDDNADLYYKLDETFTFDVKKQYDSETKEYKVEGIRFVDSEDTSYKKTISKYVKDISGRDVLITISVNTDSSTNTIVINTENNGSTPGKFYLTKTDSNGSTNLNDTTFKVIRYEVKDYNEMQLSNPTTVLNGKLSTKADGLINMIDPMMGNPGAYVYEIHETTSVAGYRNVFKRIEGNTETELAYIRLVIRNDENDKLVATQEIVRTEACTDDEYYDITTMVKNPVVNQTTRSVTLNIKNPAITAVFSVKKYRYNTAQITPGGTYKIELDKDDIDSNDMNDGGSQIIRKQNIAIGDHSLRIYELNPPSGLDNVFEQFDGVDGIRIDFSVDNYGNKAIKPIVVENEAYNFTPESKDHNAKTDDIKKISEYVKVYQIGNMIYVAIKDPTHYDFELFKKQYTGKDDISDEDKFGGTANFKITKISPVSKDEDNEIFNGVLPTDTQTKFFTEKNVKASSTYVYEITETDVSNGYYRNLVGKKIRVTINTNANGIIYDESTGKTRYEIYNEDGTELTEDEKKALDEFIKLDVDDSGKKVNLYVANMPTTGYRVRIYKVDENGKAFKRTAVFSSVMKINDVIQETRKNITTNPSTGIAYVTNGTKLVERGATHTYEIEETQAPAGCQLPDGIFKLNVKFNNNVTGNVIESASVAYYKKSATNPEELETNPTEFTGLKVTYNQGGTSTPTVTVYIPNEGTDFEVELQKVDSLGNKIEATRDSQGNIIDGVSFDVRRGNIDRNNEGSYAGENMDEFTKMINQVQNDIGNTIAFNGVLEDGTILDKIPLGENLKYTYYITETSAKKGYSNELEDKQINMTILTRRGDDGKPYVDKVEFQILDLKNPVSPDVTSKYRKYISYKLSDNNTKVNLILTNPNAYKLKLNKTDLAGNPIDSAKIEAYMDDKKLVTLNETPTYAPASYMPHESEKTSDYVGISKGETQTWKIYERSVGTPYYNIFGTDKYVEVKVKMNDNGIISVPSYTVKDVNGREYASLKSYIEQITVTTDDNGDTIVNVTFKNPSGYKLKITKFEGDGETPLEGAVVTLDGTAVISGGSYYYENNYQAGMNTSKTYKIRETKTVDSNHINVLADKEIQLTVNTDKLGNISRTYKIIKISGNTEVPPSDDVYKYVSVGDATIENGIVSIDVKILNPLTGKYNVELYKVDENGKLITNYDATFAGNRVNGKMNIKEINTSTVNGVAQIDKDVPINNVNDSYQYQLRETVAPAGYEKLEALIVLNTYFKDAASKLTLDENRTSLHVGSKAIPMSNSAGQFIDNNTEAWYIDNSKENATIKIYIKNTKKKFDLALRKYIAKVENTNKSEIPNPYRGPELNIFSLAYWKRSHTAAYFHTKEAYKVESGDIVTYRINIYNEGNVKGYATEITDYLESGLDFVDNEFNSKYGWTATKNNDGTTTVKTRYLQNTLLNECGLQGFVGNTPSTPKWFDYVEIQCKVTRPATNIRSYITDRAEITEDKAVDVSSTGVETVLDLDDIDSQPNNVKQYHEKDMLQYDSTKSYNKDSYYPGYQDDDDKETVYIEKHEYEFVLSKTDGEKEISGAKFKIEEKMDNGQYKTVFGGENGAAVNKNITISEPEARGDSTVELNKTYTYKITETATKDSNYENLLEGKYIIVKTYLDNNEMLIKGGYRESTNSYFVRYGFEIYDAETNRLIDETGDEDSELYGKIKVNINNLVQPPQIKVTIPNERLYFGKYNINFKKIDSSDKKAIEGIEFSINENKAETDANGMINVSLYSDESNNNGEVAIDKNNVNKVDIYTIDEVNIYYPDAGEADSEKTDVSDVNNYITIKDRIKLSVTKTLDESNEKYFVSNVHVDYNVNESVDIHIADANSSGSSTIYLNTVNGETVKCDISISSDGTISVVAENDKKEGNYKLKLYKVDENGDPISGIKFGVTGELSALSTDTDGYTRTITKEITADNINTPDEYTITEYEDEQGRVVGIKNPIKLTVNKKIAYKKYEFKSLKLTDTGTGAESSEGYRADLNNVEINDDSGRKVKVWAEYVATSNTITIHFTNPTTENDINVKIKKIDITTGQAVNDVTFSSKVNAEATTSATTATVNGEKGIAYIDQNRKVSSVEKFTYLIRETDIPSGTKMIKLTDFGWRLEYSTKYDEANKKYVIDESTIKIYTNQFGYDSGSYELNQKQKAIAEKMLERENGKYKYISVSEDGLTLELNIQNEDTTEYGLTIRKADMDTNAEIADAKFTVKENGTTIAEDKTLAEFAGRLAHKTGIFINTDYTYEIEETAPAAGYENIFEGVIIKFTIHINTDGTAELATGTDGQKYQIIKTAGSTANVTEIKAKINEYINKHQGITAFIEKNENNFTLNIPNPKSTIPLKVELQKYQLGNLNNAVNGAKFDVKLLKDNNGTFQSVTNAFTSGTGVESLNTITTSRNRRTEQIDDTEIEIGDTYYYELTESEVPKNFSSKFYKVIVKVTANDDKTISSSIFAIKRTSLADWSEFGTQEEDSANLSIDTSGSLVNIKWANQLGYLLNLQKLSFDYALPKTSDNKTNWAAMPLISGAKFKIQQLTPVEGEVREVEVGSSGLPEYQREIQTNTLYTYKYTEIEPPEGYYDTFKDLEITLKVFINRDGVISSANTYVTVKDGATVSDEDLEFAKKCVGAEINQASRAVYIRIANQKIHSEYKIRVCKISDKRDNEGNPVPIPNVRFKINGPTQNQVGYGYTDDDGYLTSIGIEPDGRKSLYTIEEVEVPTGVVQLTEPIELYIDTTGIPSNISYNELMEQLQTKVDSDGDGVAAEDRVQVVYRGADAPAGLNVKVNGLDVILTVPNPSEIFHFTMYKYDTVNNIINSSDGIPAANFDVSYVDDEGNVQQIQNGILDDGWLHDYRVCGPEKSYEYIIKEVDSKDGYVNILEGYELHVHLRTAINGLISDFVDNSTEYSYYELVPISGMTQRYTIQEIKEKNWIRFNVSRDVRTSSIDALIFNPYQYQLQLNKFDKNGTTPVNKAKIVAERVEGIDAEGLYYRETENKEKILKSIVDADSDDISETVTLNKKTTIMSDLYEIDNNVGMTPKAVSAQLWRIRETEVEAPYKNILGNNTIIVNTFYRELALHAAEHDEADEEGHIYKFNYYVADENGNNVTIQYKDYIDVSVEKVDGEWTVIVNIKDPMIIRMGLFKKVDSFLDEPLQGANLSLTLGSQTAEISNGSYQSEMLEAELPINSTITVSVRELSTVKGYTNILKDKVLYYVFRNTNGNISIVSKFIIDRGNMMTSGDEYDYIMSHIDLRESTDSEGFTSYKLYIENPMSFNFDLTKLDIDKNNLDGTKIKVVSSHSGEHILDGDSNLSFVEQDVDEHDIIEYIITEIHTKDGAYVNKFENPIRIVATVEGGEVKILEKWHQVLLLNGSAPMQRFDELEYFDIYVDPADKNKLADGEMQTLTIKMENPPQIKVELIKATAGRYGQRIPNTKFTIVSQDSHTAYTNNVGEISYLEEIHEPGDYTIRVYEDQVASPKYVNILENKYMQFNINVTADGTITVDNNSIKFFNKDNDSYFDNDVEITGDEASKLAEYCRAWVDNSSEISKVQVLILDPVKYDLTVKKEAADGSTLEGAEFEIVSTNGLFDTIHTTTNETGEIAKHIEIARPGVHGFKITEIKPAGNQYDNILGDNVAIIYANVSENGEISLVKNPYGGIFGNDIPEGQQYVVQKPNGAPADAEDEARIRKFVSINLTHPANEPDGITMTIVNPVQTKLDIVKRQYNIEGQEEALTNTRFTVKKNGSEMLLSNAIVNEEVEIEEHDLTDSDDYYDIYENSTNTTDGAYVNILNGKFIRVHTELKANGKLNITDEEGNVTNAFDIYQVNHFGPATKVAREGNEELYDSVSVWVSKNADGIYVLNVKVINPITINVGVIKKQYGEGAQPIPDVSITITSDNTGDHNITSTRSEEVFSEGNIKPGTYNFIVRENDNPNPRYVNVLKDRYAKANVTISKTGDITLNNIKYYTNNNVEIVDPEIKALLEETVYANIDKSGRIQKITFTIENPITLKFLVHKVDLAGNGLEGATFNVMKYVGDSDEVAKGMTSVDTNNDGVITFEDGDYMKAGIYRYEITELKPAAEKYVNILDCYDDGSQYKVVMYLKLKLNGTTEYVKDAQGTAYPNAGSTPYIIVNRNDENAEIPDEVTDIVHRYLTVGKTASRGNNPDIYEVEVTNTPQIDIDVIKVTNDSDANEEKTLTGTKFSAEADDGEGLFEDIPATQDKEYTFKNVAKGRHEFYITESEGVVNGGYINVLENRYVRVRTTVDESGVMKIMNNNWEEDEDYFEIYEGQYNNRAGSRLLDRTEYAKIYECVSVESVRQTNGVYKLNLKVNNPERNYNIKLNKKVFGEEDINMEGIEFFIRSTVDNKDHQLTTDKDGNLTFEEKRVPVGIYEYRVTETKTSGPEFVNVLENNYILVRLKVNQDGSIEIVDTNNEAKGNEDKYYVLDAKCTEIIDNDKTIVDDFVRVATDNEGDEPELDFFIKDPERINLKLVKRDVLTNEKMNNVTFTTNVYYQTAGASADPSEADKAELVNAETFEKIDISTIKTDTVDGVDGVILVQDILIDKTGTYTFVFHEESTDGLFKYLYKSHAEDITLKIDISVEKNSEGRPIGYKVGQPRIVTGAKYVDDEATLTTPTKAQLVRAEVLNAPIRGHYDLVLSKLDKYTNRKLDGAEFDIKAEKNGEKYELYEDVDDLRIENAIIPDHFTVQNGEIRIENIRITPPPYQAPAADGTLETFNIILTETKAPAGYMLLDEPIVLEVTTAVDGEYDDAEYIVKSVNLVSGDNYGLVTKTFGKNEINVVAKNEYFDLALRKSIVSVAYSDSDEAKITEDETKDRVPVIYEDDEIYNLNPGVTTANYRHVKNHVRVYPGQEVIYCLRVYNEGEIDGYAEKITDHLPEGLEFLPNDKFNQERGWTYDLTDQSLKTVYTTFLSKENNPNNDRFNAENNLIKAMDENVATGVNHKLDFKEIEIKCKVSDNLRPGVILTNIAEITEYKAEGRTSETVDRDSDGGNADVPNGKDLQNYKESELTDNREDYVPGQEDDDDFEKLIVVEFDLALRKYITAINDEEVLADEKEAKYTDEVVKDTEDILGEGTASDDTEGTNEGANTNIVDESEGENDNTEDVNAQTGENPDENKDEDKESDKEDIDDDNTIKYDREPRVNVSTLKSGDQDSIYKDPDEPTTALYNHTKAPVEVSVDDIVTYTLEVFNEGTVDGYASLIKDDIPEGVEFVQYTEGDGSVNDKYRWKMVNENDEEVTDPKDAKYIVSDYLSKDNETEENGNLIRAFDPVTGTRLDSKYVQVQFRVICKQDYPKIITNYAQISDDTDDGGKSVRDRDSHTNEWIDGEDDQDVEHIWVTYMDLALRKFITGVTDFKTGITQVVDTRIPQVDPTALIDETGTTAKYEHTKEPVLVHTNDVVIYTLRIYNEGSKDGYATQIKDDLPEGLEYLPDHEINKYYEWSLVDKNDKPVTRLEDATFAVTNYLSKDNETEERQNLLKSFDYYDYENDKPAKRETPEYKDIKIAFKVTEPQTSDRILINEAQISEQTDGKGIHREDRDSTPNEWLGEDDEDIEKVRVLYFDLALRKWVTKAIVTQDGEEKVFETGHHAEDDPEDVVKVDLKKSKINKVVVKFEYQIRITNEGEIDGYAKEIKDRIPEGLRFDPADNPTWTQLEENIIVTDELKDTLLKPGESAEVTVVLTWINSGDNLGLKVNVAEISKDYNDYGTHDIDSTPDNNVWGEDDIDDAPVMLAVKTGNAVFGYIALAVFVGAIIVIGVRRIKKINEG